MMSWLNSRAITVAASLLVLLRVSRQDGRVFDERYAMIACAAFFMAYVVAFLLPLWRSFGVVRILVPFCALLAGWGALALALTADARPILADNGIAHRTNWPMVAFFIAAALALALFFENTARGFRRRKELSPRFESGPFEEEV